MLACAQGGGAATYCGKRLFTALFGTRASFQCAPPDLSKMLIEQASLNHNSLLFHWNLLKQYELKITF